jgi:hypothetical protein
MSLQRIVIDCGALSAAGFQSVCDLSPGQLPALNNLVNYLSSVPDQQAASLSINVGATKATGTITTAAGGSANNETMTICGVTFTAKTSGATGNQFNISATAATQAANIASAINAATSFAGIVTAAVTGAGIVTVSAVVPGKIGNGLVMANVNLANVTVVSFASASDGTAYTLDLD